MLDDVGRTALTPSQANWLIASLVVCLGCLTYANTLSGEFVWDDASSILLHKTVQEPSRLFQLFREDQHAYGRGQGTFYRPLVAATFMADFSIAYDGPRPIEGIPEVSPLLFHAGNTAWHVAASILLLLLLMRLRAPMFVRAVVPIVYVIHPLHTEAVAYISGRADSMAATFMFAGLCFATWDESPRRRTIGVAGVCATFTAALLSKESAMIFPALAALVIWARAETQSNWRRRYTPVIASLVVLALYLGIKAAFLNFPSDSISRVTSLGGRLVEVLQAFALYLGLLVAPMGLHMERSLEDVPSAVAILGVIALIGMLAALVWEFRSGRRRVAAGLGWFFLTWLPISGIYPLNAPMAEHWMYVPMAGLFWAAAELLWPALRNPMALRMAAAAVFVWCVFLIGISVDRNRDWRSDEALFTATLAENPNSLRVRYNLAVVYEDLTRNPFGAEREFSKFIESYEALAANAPEDAASYVETALESYLSLANLYRARGDLQRSAQQLQKALAHPVTEHTKIHIGEASLAMGQLFLSVGDVERARRAFTRAVELRPEFAPLVEQMLSGPPQQQAA